MCTSRIPGSLPLSLSWETVGSRSSGRPRVKKHQSSTGRCRAAVVMSKLDIFAKSQASVCTDKKSVLKKEMASVLLAERLANMAPEQELWTSYPLSAREATVRALSTQTALRHTLSPRPYARCVSANGRFTELAYSVAATFRPDGTSNSESLQWSAPLDDLVQQATGVDRGTQPSGTRSTGTGCSRRAPERHLTGTGVAPLFRSTS